MTIDRSHALKFRTGNTTYAYYGYTSYINGNHYLGFRAGNVTRYVPLTLNGSGKLKVRIADYTYAVARCSTTVTVAITVVTTFSFVNNCTFTLQNIAVSPNNFAFATTATVKIGSTSVSGTLPANTSSKSIGTKSSTFTCAKGTKGTATLSFVCDGSTYTGSAIFTYPAQGGTTVNISCSVAL